MRHFLLSTDWWTDCDDAVALRILLRAHKEKRIKIDAIIINACMEYSVPSLEGFMNLEGVFDIPIGIDKNANDFGGNPPYQERLSAFSQKYKTNDDADDAVVLYKTTLENSESPVEIIEIGYLQAISNFLESKNGVYLVKEKVSKFWVMAGKWDEKNGRENNFCRNKRSIDGAVKFCKLCPVPITFLGFEIGVDVITGDELDKNDFLYMALKDHGSENGRSSWDPMLVTMAIIGNEEKAGYKTIKGNASVDDDGCCDFEENQNGNHMFVIKQEQNDYYKNMINSLIK